MDCQTTLDISPTETEVWNDCLENKLLLISINLGPLKPAKPVALKNGTSYVFQMEPKNIPIKHKTSVSVFCLDVYRAITPLDVSEQNAFRVLLTRYDWRMSTGRLK